MQIRAGWKQSGKVVDVVVDEGEDDVVVVVREVEEERKRKKKAHIRKEAEGVGGGRGQEGNYRPSRAAGRSFIGPDEEKKDWQAAGVDERTKTRRGTAPAPFSLVWPHTTWLPRLFVLLSLLAHVDRVCLCIYPPLNRHKLENQKHHYI